MLQLHCNSPPTDYSSHKCLHFSSFLEKKLQWEPFFFDFCCCLRIISGSVVMRVCVNQCRPAHHPHDRPPLMQWGGQQPNSPCGDVPLPCPHFILPTLYLANPVLFFQWGGGDCLLSHLLSSTFIRLGLVALHSSYLYLNTSKGMFAYS